MKVLQKFTKSTGYVGGTVKLEFRYFCISISISNAQILLKLSARKV